MNSGDQGRHLGHLFVCPIFRELDAIHPQVMLHMLDAGRSREGYNSAVSRKLEESLLGGDLVHFCDGNEWLVRKEARGTRERPERPFGVGIT